MKYFTLCLVLIICTSCKQQDKPNVSEAYKKEHEAYIKQLHEGRKAGYLQIVGLHKLDSMSSIGQGKSNTVVLNVNNTPETLGTITIADSTLQFTASKDVKITNSKDSLITHMNLGLDTYGSSIRMYHKHINWQVITRSGSLYLRVWNTLNPEIDTFKGYKFYDINPELILQGDFTYYDKAKTASVKSQLGVNANTNFIGKVSFQYKGNTYSLDVGSSGFTMVGDATSGSDTYGGGRYLYLDLPEQNGTVEIDFNKLYNPPCSFNKYTTCLYPPRQNLLAFEVMAGETMQSN